MDKSANVATCKDMGVFRNMYCMKADRADIGLIEWMHLATDEERLAHRTYHCYK